MRRRWQQWMLHGSQFQALKALLLVSVPLCIVFFFGLRRVADGSFVLILTSASNGLLGALIYALRLRMSEPGQRFAYELRAASSFSLAASASFMLAASTIQLYDLDVLQPALLMFTAAILLSVNGVTYLGMRGCIALARRWNQMRQQKLFWALIHDQILAIIVLFILIGFAGSGFVLVSTVFMDTTSSFGMLTRLLQQLLNLVVLTPLYAAMVAVIILGALPIAVLISFLMVRRIVRRITTLASATEALRQGDYARRIAVQGRDEIASLQRDFNSMAGELEQTLGALL